MENIINLTHRTKRKNYYKILNDGYLIPKKAKTGRGIFLTIKLDEDLLKKEPMTYYGKYEINIDKTILLNRNDYIIRNLYYDKKTYFVSFETLFDAHKDNKNILENKLKKLVLLNEIVFDNKISLNKYQLK